MRPLNRVQSRRSGGEHGGLGAFLRAGGSTRFSSVFFGPGSNVEKNVNPELIPLLGGGKPLLRADSSGDCDRWANY